MKSSERCIRYFAGAALGVMLALNPAAADSGAAVPLEQENPTVVGVAAGSDAAATDPSQQTTKKKKKKAARSGSMVAVPLETIQPPGATVQAPPAAPAAAAQAAEGTAAPAPAPAAAPPQGAPPVPQAQGAATGEAAAAATSAPAAMAAGTVVEAVPAAESPAPKQRRQLGMQSTAPRTAPAAGAAAAIVRKDIIGVVPPTGRITGRVLAKDGITMLGGAELILDHGAFGSQHRVVTDASGEFDIELPIGRYALAIQRRHEIYESSTSYSVAGYGTLPIDFILLRDFEEELPPAPEKKGSLAGGDVSRPDKAAVDDGSARWLPEPPREPEVVGSVVDLVSPTQDAPARSRKNGAETMGFLGSLLAILIIL